MGFFAFETETCFKIHFTGQQNTWTVCRFLPSTVKNPLYYRWSFLKPRHAKYGNELVFSINKSLGTLAKIPNKLHSEQLIHE